MISGPSTGGTATVVSGSEPVTFDVTHKPTAPTSSTKAGTMGGTGTCNVNSMETSSFVSPVAAIGTATASTGCHIPVKPLGT